MKDLWEQIELDNRPIVLYGMTDVAEKVIFECEKHHRKVSAVFASDDFVRNKVFMGFPVTTLKEVEEQFDDFIILLCFGTHRIDVINHIKEIAKEHPVFAPDFPVIGEGLFLGKYYNDNIEEYEKTRSLLKDEQRRRVFDETIKYRLSGNLEHLYSVETDDVDNWNLVSDSNVLFDFGAYNGDTASLFEQINPNYKSIFAIEPSSRNYRKLKEYCNNKYNIYPYNIGVSDKDEEVLFPKNSGRGSHNKKMETASFTTIDSLVENWEKENLYHREDNLLCKFDVEGWEKKAISGAENLIRNVTPNLYIAAYHRLDDLIEIPKQILEINKDYDVYLRHSPCIPAWENNYIFVKKEKAQN